MYSFLSHSMRDLQKSWKQILLFASIYMAATSLLFAPAVNFLMHRLFRMTEAGHLLNAEVYRMALSYRGLIVLTAICFLAGLILFLKLGTVIVIVQQRLFGKAIFLSDAFATALRAVPRLIGLGFVQLLLLFLIFLPFLDSPLSEMLLGSINLQIFLISQLYGSWITLILYIILLLCAVYLFLRCIFALHYILIEGHRTGRALRNSFRLTKSKQWNVLFYLVLVNVAMYAALTMILYIVSFLMTRYSLPGLPFEVKSWVVPVTGFISFVFTMLVIPVNLHVLTRLFYVFRRMQGVPVRDHLVVHQSRVLRRAEKLGSNYFDTRSFRYSILLFAVVYAVSAIALHNSYGSRFVYLQWDVKVIGHRGDVQHAPENSISGIRSALQQGVNAVEIDVQLTEDGVVVLNHDYTLERVAGLPMSVHDLTMPEIATLDIRGSWTGMPPERIPTLYEALQEIKGKSKLVIEIKPYGDKDRLAAKVAEMIIAEGMLEETYVQSFDYSVLQTVKGINEDIRVGQVLYAAAGNLSALNVDFYTISQNMLSERFIQSAHKLDREVWVWTVNLERTMKEVLKYDVDGIITDYPAKLLSLISVE